MSIFIFLCMNIIICASAFLFVFRILRIEDSTTSFPAFLLFYFSQITVTLLTLGVFNLLYINNVVILNLLALLVILAISRQRASTFAFGRQTGGLISKALRNKVILLSVSVIAAFGVGKLFINLVNPPFGWDSLNYHFTFAVEWLKNGNLAIPPTVFDDPSPSYYPINGSLFYLWLMLPLKNVFMADLGQVPFFALACLSVYGIARKIGLRREYAFYASALFLLIPNFFKQLQVAYVDVMVAALFLAATYFLLLIEESFSWQNVLLFAMSCGLLIGTKTVALPYSVLLLIPFIFLCGKNYRKAHIAAVAVITVVILGGFSYLRNFIETGNPLYPLNFELFGRSIFQGVMDKAVYKAHFKAEDYALSKALFHEGLGAQTLIFVLPSIFLGLPVIWLKKRKISFNLGFFLLLPLLIYLVYHYVIPLANLRYIYPLFGIAIAIGFLVCQVLDIPEKIVKGAVVVCVLASISELAKRQELIFGIIFSSVLFILLPVIYKLASKIKYRARLTLFLCGCLFLSLLWLNDNYNRNEYRRYLVMQKYSGFWPEAIKSWIWLNDFTTGQNIAYAGRPVPFPLYGTGLKNNVYYVSVNNIDPLQLHYFKNAHYAWGHDFLSLHRNLEENGNYREKADFGAWSRNLAERNTDYLFVYSLHQIKGIEFPVEDKWALADPGKFIPVFSNSIVHIYKIRK